MTGSLLCCLFLGHALLRGQAVPSFAVPFAIPGTEVRQLHSDIVGQDYELYVKLPWTYGSRDTVYPVVYCLDGNRFFPMIANISQVLETPGRPVVERVIVGIGYRSGTLGNWAAWRTRDLTPTRDTSMERIWQNFVSRVDSGPHMVVETGGAAKFLDFITSEMIPFVEENYRVSRTDRCLMGYSHGGLFALYALFRAPGTFARCFVGSPSLYWDNRLLFRMEAEYAATHRDLPVRLFLTAGGMEDSAMTANARRMDERLRSRRYAGLRLETMVFENETHDSCMPVAATRALRVLYGEK